MPEMTRQHSSRCAAGKAVRLQFARGGGVGGGVGGGGALVQGHAGTESHPHPQHLGARRLRPRPEGRVCAAGWLPIVGLAGGSVSA